MSIYFFNVLLIAELRTVILTLILSFCANDLLQVCGLSVANQENAPIQ